LPSSWLPGDALGADRIRTSTVPGSSGSVLPKAELVARWRCNQEILRRQAAAVIDAMPPGPDKDGLQVEYARELLSRIHQ